MLRKFLLIPIALFSLAVLPTAVAQMRFTYNKGQSIEPAFEGWIVRIEPLERELAVFDPLDGGEPEALELPLLVPIGGKNPRPDPQRLPGIGRAGEVGSVGRQWAGMDDVLGLF